MNEPTSKRPNPLLRFFLALGPAFIVASVVIGPGSVLSSSTVGRDNGFSMVWVVFLASGLMACMVALGARLGVILKDTLCAELAGRLSRPVSALIGLTIFMIASGYQFGNNLGVLLALEPLFPKGTGEHQVVSLQNLVLLVLNIAIIGFLFYFRHLYKPVETLMKVLVGTMLVAFFTNFLFLLVIGTGNASAKSAAIIDATAPATADLAAAPETVETSPAEPSEKSSFASLVAIIGLISTTFVIPAAFYQAYLVREKGWNVDQLKDGLIDSIAGVTVLASITLVIMLTAAIAFHGRDDSRQITILVASDEAASAAPGERIVTPQTPTLIEGLQVADSGGSDITAELNVARGVLYIAPAEEKPNSEGALADQPFDIKKAASSLELVGSAKDVNTKLARLTYLSNGTKNDKLRIKTDVSFKSVADVARQLEPLFGAKALVLFSAGIFAAAFSSFLVNAMIGGSMFADGLGLGGTMDSQAAKTFTSIALVIGMCVAVFIPPANRVYFIVMAQAGVVIGLPLIALAMIYLGLQIRGEHKTPLWMTIGAVFGLLVVSVSAVLLASRLIPKILELLQQ